MAAKHKCGVGGGVGGKCHFPICLSVWLLLSDIYLKKVENQQAFVMQMISHNSTCEEEH